MAAIPYHCSVVVHSRAKGHSATAAAAYRSGSQIADERTGEIHDYTRKKGVEHSEIVLPEGSPNWATDRAKLWNAAEAAERNKDGSDRAKACIVREMKLAFPAQLNFDDRRDMVQQIAQEIAERHGVAVDVAMHEPDSEGDQRNYHAHVMFSTRRIEQDGFGKKTRELDDRKTGAKLVENYRESWATICAEKLKERGHNVDAERWRFGYMTKSKQADKAMERGDYDYAREVLREGSTVHLGPAATAMERRGVKTELGDINRAIKLDGVQFDSERENRAAEIAENPEIILEEVTRTKAVFDRRDIAKELNRYIDDAGQFQQIMAQLEASPELVQLEPEHRGQGRTIPAKYSTREMVNTERSMIASAQALSERNGHAVSTKALDKVLAKHGTLSDEQRSAVEGVTSANGLHVIVGDAGTGKSFAMRVAKEAWEAEGYRVRGAALAGKAADELQAGSGIDSRTLHSMEAAWSKGKDLLTKRDVLVIDEAGMVGSRQLGRVLDAAEKAGAKVVMLGDDKQLAAIEAGAGFRAITERVGASEITQIRRQSEAWAKNASAEFARGDVRAALDAYNERGHVKIAGTREEAKQAIAADYLADREKGGSSIILAHTNADVLSLNSTIHATRKEAGELGECVEFLTERGNREFGAGDRVVFLSNDNNLGVKNGTLGTVEATEDGSLTVKLDSGKSVAFNADQYGNIDHGYAVTVHKSQGVTVDRAYLLATSSMDRSLAYVGMTRHRDAATLYAGVDDFAGSGAGKLVDHGAAPYENNPTNSGSYFATLENDKGEQRTVWGVDIQRAIAESGAELGDKISLEHKGSVPVTLPSGEIAERNQWEVRSGENLAFEALAKQLEKQAPKESTLDYNESLHGFAERQDFDGDTVVKRWIERGRAAIGKLSEKMENAFAHITGRDNNQQEPQTRAPVGFVRRDYSDADLIGDSVEQPVQAQENSDNIRVLDGLRGELDEARDDWPGGATEAMAMAKLAKAEELAQAGEPLAHHLQTIEKAGGDAFASWTAQQQRVQAGLDPEPSQQEIVQEQPGNSRLLDSLRNELDNARKDDANGPTEAMAAGKLAKAEELAQAGEPLAHHLQAIEKAGGDAFTSWVTKQQQIQAGQQEPLTQHEKKALDEMNHAREREHRQRGRDHGHGY